VARKRFYIVFYMKNDGQVYIDSVSGVANKAYLRTDEISKWKWVNQSWVLPMDMNELDLQIPIKTKPIPVL
jgi:hypothetical protein